MLLKITYIHTYLLKYDDGDSMSTAQMPLRPYLFCFTVPLSAPEVTSDVRSPAHQSGDDDATALLRRQMSSSRDQDGVGGASPSKKPTGGGMAAGGPLSLRLSTLAPLGGLDAHRRRRTAFTSDQLLELEKEFHSRMC